MGNPSLVTISQTNKAIRGEAGLILTIKVDSTAEGAGSPSHRLAAGNVLATKSDGKYIEADRYSELTAVVAPTFVSAEVPDSDWAGKVVKLYSDGAEVASVTLGGADDTLAEVVSALNGDASFAKHATASADTNLRITSDFAGRGHSIGASINLTTGFATISGSSSYQSDAGSFPTYAITTEPLDLKDINGVAKDNGCSAAISGRFNTADLRNLTGQAKAALEKQGCVFYS